MSRRPPRRGERDDMSEGKRFNLYDSAGTEHLQRIDESDGKYVLASDAAALTLTWREEKPTVPGKYWYQRLDLPPDIAEPTILDVRMVDGALKAYDNFCDGESPWHSLNRYGGRWAGPLATPQDGTREG